MCLRLAESTLPRWMAFSECYGALAALRDIPGGRVEVEKRREYEMVETLLRNISAGDFTPAERYYAQALATTTFVARNQALRGVVRDIGGNAPQSPVTSHHLASLMHAGDWAAFEKVLRTAATTAPKSPDEDVVPATLGARQLLEDAESLLGIRTTTSLSGDYPPPPTSFEVQYLAGRVGTYLSLWPQVFSGALRMKYGVGLTRGETGRGRIIWIDMVDKNPLHTRVSSSAPVLDATPPSSDEP